MNVYYPKELDGEVARGEAELIARICRRAAGLGPHAALEIGTLWGSTTNNIASNFEGRILTVDLPKGNRPMLPHDPKEDKYFDQGKHFLPEFEGRIDQCWVDSAQLELPQTITLSFAFIDGSHSEVYVMNDFAKVEPSMVNGGYVLFHDYASQCWPGVSTGIHKLIGIYPQHVFTHIITSTIVCCLINK